MGRHNIAQVWFSQVLIFLVMMYIELRLFKGTRATGGEELDDQRCSSLNHSKAFTLSRTPRLILIMSFVQP